MLLKLIANVQNSNLVELHIDGHFVRYVKISDLPLLSQGVNGFLLNQELVNLDDPSQSLTLTAQSEYDLGDLDESQEELLRTLLETGPNKHKVELPQNLATSAQNNPVVFSYRNLGEFQNYWQNQSLDKKTMLYQVLSADLIETPYVDDPRDYIERQNVIAYHTNHGTCHGIRQDKLSVAYLQLIKAQGNAVTLKTANSLTGEEEACLQLAAFLFRSGRTNELSWRDDATYGQRSAAIFKQVAIDLGFNTAIVDLIALCFDYHSKNEHITPLPNHTMQETRSKLDLFTSILKLSHESDLIRVNMDGYAKQREPIVAELEKVLGEESDVASVADALLLYAGQLCAETGAPITDSSLRERVAQSFNELKTTRKGMNPSMTGNQVIAAKSANELRQTYYRLLELSPAIFPGFTSATALWIESDEHTYSTEDGTSSLKKEKESVQEERTPFQRSTTGHFLIWGHSDTNKILMKDSWTPQSIQAIPTKPCIEEELQLAETHVSIYHATTKASYALDLFCRELKRLSEGANHVAWLRDFHSKPRGRIYTEIEEIKSKMSDGRSVDNSENVSWNLLSCSPSLWQNADFASEESTVDYFYNNSSVTRLNFKTILHDLWDKEGLLVGQNDLRKKLVDDFNELVNDPAFGSQGVIYQFMIPHHLVDEMAYISKENGIYDPSNPSALNTLLKLKTPEQQAPNHHTLQVRLLVSKVINPDIAKSIQVHNHVNMQTSLHDTLKSRVAVMAEMAYSGPTEGVKKKVEVKDEKASYSFNLLSSLTRVEIPLTPVKPKKQVEVSDEWFFDFFTPAESEATTEAPHSTSESDSEMTSQSNGFPC
ncbi:SidE phosphodiesterase domain-containing protein [Legionella taurinensis]|uniref:SidE PDE domain-containing protein n=1 Tax=Legionella taurinensis TaxID=70611 RepID=A0A3A5L8R3_9GAMM|nr:SidE phosphodiesterase domain-containing protein [Legionella taurinensis]RJT46938.1 hypothetical protein D6J04_07875 [Legionella taurinensis]RJT66861.1 hypothetical protein D6J03_09230 [Legionella taurinensis]STY25416.1 Uncharacterised protein [Legionella taurinensis]